MANLESLLVSRALDFCHGNQVHTAKLLGISRNVLRTYPKRSGLLSSAGVDRQPSRASAVAPAVRSKSAPGFGRYPLHYRDAVRGELV
jgi:sigma-54 dependent transcriptional regulator